MKVRVYQANISADYKFRGYDEARAAGGPDRDDYRRVFVGELNLNKDSSIALEEIFKWFNGCERPESYKGHSLSVSDVVSLNGVNYYCDNFGWRKIDFETGEEIA